MIGWKEKGEVGEERKEERKKGKRCRAVSQSWRVGAAEVASVCKALMFSP